MPPRNCSRDVVALRGAFALEFAEHLVATLVRPDAAAHEPRVAVDERDHLGAESHAGALRAREQHRPPQVEDRATPIRAEGDGLATAGGIPGALELQPFAGRCVRLRRLRRRSTGRRGHGQGEEDVTSRHAAREPSIVRRCPCARAHGSLRWLVALPATAMALRIPIPSCGPELLDVVRSCIPCSCRVLGIGGRQRRAAGWGVDGVRVSVPREPCAHASSRTVTMPQIVSGTVGAPKHVCCLPLPARSAGMFLSPATGLEHRRPQSRARRSGPARAPRGHLAAL